MANRFDAIRQPAIQAMNQRRREAAALKSERAMVSLEPGWSGLVCAVLQDVRRKKTKPEHRQAMLKNLQCMMEHCDDPAISDMELR